MWSWKGIFKNLNSNNHLGSLKTQSKWPVVRVTVWLFPLLLLKQSRGSTVQWAQLWQWLRMCKMLWNQFASIQEVDNHITITWDCYKNRCDYVFLKTRETASNTIYLLYETRSLISPVFPGQLGKTDWPASPGITHLCLLSTGVTSVCTYAHQFCIDSGDQTRVPVLSGHAFYWLSHLPRSAMNISKRL